MISGRNSVPTVFAAAVLALVCGLVFGIGLIVAGMHNPEKVRGFLDLFGHWQPALIAVMGSAIPVFALLYFSSKRCRRPWFAERFHYPTLAGVSGRLVTGATLFGVGWGLVGLCPGPALVDMFSLNGDVWIFLVALLLGNRIAHYFFGPAATPAAKP
jgi:uncharacterized membrane protein YedE/YeeE